MVRKEDFKPNLKLVTQFGRMQGLDLLNQLRDRRLNYETLKEEAATSEKKARKLRQVNVLLAIVKEQGLDALEEMLNNPEYDSFAVDEKGNLRVKRAKTKELYKKIAEMRF